MVLYVSMDTPMPAQTRANAFNHTQPYVQTDTHTPFTSSLSVSHKVRGVGVCVCLCTCVYVCECASVRACVCFKKCVSIGVCADFQLDPGL